MSFKYDLYLDQHRNGVMKAFYWIEENIPEEIIKKYKEEFSHNFSYDYYCFNDCAL